MNDINRVTVSGNLTRNPDLRAQPSGSMVLNFGLAVNDSRKNKDTGSWEEFPNFVDVVVFGGRAEWLARNIRMGTKVCVEGKLRYSSWVGKDGQKRHKLEIAADTVIVMDSKREAEPAQPPSFAAPAPAIPEPPADSIYDEDIPF